MRVLHVLSKIDPKCGGPVNALGGLTRAQHEAGLDVRIVSTIDPTRADRSLAENLQQHGVTVELIGPAKGALLRHPDLKPTLERHSSDADVVHIHGLWNEAHHLGASVARRLNVPYIIRTCGMLDPWSLSQSRWKKKMFMFLRARTDLNGAAVLHFTDELERDLTAPLKLKAPSLVEVNGVDLSEYETLPPRGAFRKKHPAVGDRPMVIYLSRIHYKKGLDLLVPAFAKVKQTIGDLVLVVVGPDNNFRHKIEQISREHGVADDVIFTGLLRGEEKVAALRDADLFALTSRQENFGIVVVEALAAGTPVLISDQVNIHEKITAAGVGQVVPMDIDRIAAELTRWMSDERLRQSAAEKARPFVWEKYDWNAIARRWVDHYERIVREHRGTLRTAMR